MRVEPHMEICEAIVDQRLLEDRRNFSWQTVFFGFLRSRRRELRREEDAEILFLDWHHPWLFFLSVGIMLMSCLDAFMTLKLIEAGMVEVNPFMAAMLGHGTETFAASKMLMTGTSILTLVFLAKARIFNRFRTGAFLTLFFSVYACLVCYEFVYLLKLV